MVTRSRYLEAPRRLRAFVRAHESSLVVLAVLIGATGGLLVAAMSNAVEALHVVLFNLDWGERLSSQFRIEPLRALLVPRRCMAGGCRFAAVSSWRCRRCGRAVSAPRSGWRPAIPSWPPASPPPWAA